MSERALRDGELVRTRDGVVHVICDDDAESRYMFSACRIMCVHEDNKELYLVWAQYAGTASADYVTCLECASYLSCPGGQQ